MGNDSVAGAGRGSELPCASSRRVTVSKRVAFSGASAAKPPLPQSANQQPAPAAHAPSHAPSDQEGKVRRVQGPLSGAHTGGGRAQGIIAAAGTPAYGRAREVPQEADGVVGMGPANTANTSTNTNTRTKNTGTGREDARSLAQPPPGGGGGLATPMEVKCSRAQKNGGLAPVSTRPAGSDQATLSATLSAQGDRRLGPVGDGGGESKSPMTERETERRVVCTDAVTGSETRPRSAAPALSSTRCLSRSEDAGFAAATMRVNAAMCVYIYMRMYLHGCNASIHGCSASPPAALASNNVCPHRVQRIRRLFPSPRARPWSARPTWDKAPAKALDASSWQLKRR